MKMLLATVAIATLLTSTAFAQTRRQVAEPSPYLAFGQAGPVGPAYSPYAYGRVRTANPSFDVYDTRGRYIGSDPDPRIRSELMRDPPGTGD